MKKMLGTAFEYFFFWGGEDLIGAFRINLLVFQGFDCPDSAQFTQQYEGSTPQKSERSICLS